jgi:two-component system sensor kinase FixL
MDIVERLFEYSDQHRKPVYAFAFALAAIISAADWQIHNVPLGFLYIVPILLASGLFDGAQVLAAAAISALLREEFSPLSWGKGASIRVCVGFLAFALAGYFVSQLNRKRKIILQALKEREEQIRLRQAAEQKLRILIETSPLAIITLDSSGHVMLSNGSAQKLLGFDHEPMQGVDVRSLLPILSRVLKQQSSEFHTTVECKAQRRDGEVFLAYIWLSIYQTAAGQELAAVIWDASDNLRDKEGAGLDSMMATSRVVIGAVSHEIRNLACAAMSAYKDLFPVPGLDRNEQFRTLGTVLQGLERIAYSGLAMSSDPESAVTELGTVLDEARIVIEPGIRDAGGNITWNIPAGLPLVQADHHGLFQVFLNLARNSENALRGSGVKELTVEACADRDVVAVRFRDTGGGVANPEELFKPFQSGAKSAGLGLYISRAIIRAHGGDLRYHSESGGSCFTVELWQAGHAAATV